MLGVFAASLFTSAALLFSIQPMSAKMLLPMFGGTPAVWNTCMVFYQTALLAGYVYAHLTAKWLGIRRQALLHMALLLLAAFMLPVAFPEPVSSSLATAPIVGILKMLFAALGLPLFLISATAPMLQKWFSHTSHGSAHDPYFLYAASNVGSMSALLAYPVVIEPFLPLREQAGTWAVGFIVMGVLIATCALLARKYAVEQSVGALPLSSDAAGTMPVAESAPQIVFTQKLRWLALSFVPSSMLLGVTNFITTDIAAVPLLWVIPLALYLLTFVIVFSRKPLLGHSFVLRAQAVLVLPVALLFFGQNPTPMLFFHLAAFFASAMVCHGELARSRPSTAHLTEFYIWMSAGGILGGAFNVLAAPALFDSLLEYPLAITLACLLRPSTGTGDRTTGVVRNDLVLPLLLFGLVAGAGLVSPKGLFKSFSVGTAGAAIASALFCLRSSNRPLRFGLGVGAVILAASLFGTTGVNVLYTERSFFGIHKVLQEDEGRIITLTNGKTLHGAQSTTPALRREPLTYYHRTSPIAQVLELPTRKADRQVAVIGLGTGTLSCYAKAGEHWTFYEIDPAVVLIAQDRNYFTFMKDAPASENVILGDARLSLSDAPDKQYDIIVLDAFSSDAIPVHLLTGEAIRLYLSKLAPEGLIAVHISNRFLDLQPVLATLAQSEKLFGMARNDPADQNMSDFKFPSSWAVLARSRADAGVLADDVSWEPLQAGPKDREWTDNFSNIISVLRF